MFQDIKLFSCFTFGNGSLLKTIESVWNANERISEHGEVRNMCIGMVIKVTKKKEHKE